MLSTKRTQESNAPIRPSLAQAPASSPRSSQISLPSSGSPESTHASELVKRTQLPSHSKPPISCTETTGKKLRTSSKSQDDASMIKQAEHLIQQSRRGEISFSNAVSGLLNLIPDASTPETPGYETYMEYLLKLHEEPFNADWTPNTVQSSSRHAFNPRARTPLLDSPDVKRVRVDKMHMPWLSANAGGPERLREDLQRTYLQLLEFSKDTEAVLRSVVNWAHGIYFPESEWLSLINGDCVDFDNIHVHRLTTNSSMSNHRRNAKPANFIQNQSQWELAWSRFAKATFFIFPQRRSELEGYHEWIQERFESYQDIHQGLAIRLDKFIRLEACTRCDLALDERDKLAQLESSFFHDRGTGATLATSEMRVKRSRTTRETTRTVQEVCRRFNRGHCPFTINACYYSHVCLQCQSPDHVMEQCTAASN